MDLTSLIARQRAHFQTGRTRPLEFRLEQLRTLHRAIETNETQLLQALHADLRKSAQEAYVSEIGFVLSEIRYVLKHLASWMKPQQRGVPLMLWPGSGRIQWEPYGVALILGPWNYPLQLLFTPLVGAIAAGNCVCMKASEHAPHTAAVMAKLIRDSFPDEYVAVVEGDRSVAESLLRERFDTIFFTGSTHVGKAVMAAATQHLTPVTLELGGKCPALVCADAPLDVTPRRIVWGKFMNAGQTCVAPDFVLADRRIRQPLVEALKLAVREFYGDDPQRSSDYGRIVNRHHFDRLLRFAPNAQYNIGELYIAPTILTDVSWDAPVMQDEIFGPILPVLEFDSLDDVLAKLRNRPTPLALYLFTNEHPTQERVVAGTRSGGVCINDTVVQIFGKQLPFGGVGDSGMGRYHGKASFDCFSQQRAIVYRSTAFDSRFRYPPPKLSLEKLKKAYRWLLGR